jgi:hypothetical protein
MRKLYKLMVLLVFTCTFQFVYAEPTLDISLEPNPIFDQVWAYESYLVSVTLSNFNLSEINLTDYSGIPSESRFTGAIQWRGKGGYKFGNSTTGYNYDLSIALKHLEETTIEQIVPLNVDKIAFNFTIKNDAFEYLMQPYENVEIIFRLNTHLVMSDGSIGPTLSSITKTFYLVDDFKVNFLEGKYQEMQDEIKTVVEAEGLDSFNRQRYLNILKDMNTSLVEGNYILALDIWDDYDNGDRADIIFDLIRASEIQSEELKRLESVRQQLQDAENRIELLQREYEQLEQQYAALSNTYHRVNAELDAAKRNLTTAITAVFLTAIVFFFLGRRMVKT